MEKRGADSKTDYAYDDRGFLLGDYSCWKRPALLLPTGVKQV